MILRTTLPGHQQSAYGFKTILIFLYSESLPARPGLRLPLRKGRGV